MKKYKEVLIKTNSKFYLIIFFFFKKKYLMIKKLNTFPFFYMKTKSNKLINKK